MSLLVKDAAGANQTVNTLPPLGAAPSAASLPVALAPDQLAGLATTAKQIELKGAIDALAPLLDGLETILGAISTALNGAVYYPATQPVSAAALPLPNGAATSEKQDAQAASTAMIGTRAYKTALARVAVASASAQSAAVVGAEVLVHASTRCFIAIGADPVATTNDIPLEAGEKLHLRLTSGHKIAVLRDTADGFLNVIPVA